MRRVRDQDGTAVVEFVWLALLLLVPLLYIVLAAFEAQRTAYAASAAARSAGRAFVEGADLADARRRAEVAATTVFGDQGVEGSFELRITCRPRPDECLSPGSVVTAVVRATARLPLVPDVLGGSAPGVSITAEHRSPYGTFRERR